MWLILAGGCIAGLTVGIWCLTASYPIGWLLLFGGAFLGLPSWHIYQQDKLILRLRKRQHVLVAGIRSVNDMIKVTLANNGGVTGYVPHGRRLEWRQILEGGTIYRNDKLAAHVEPMVDLTKAFDELKISIVWDDGRERAPDWVPQSTKNPTILF